MVQSQLLPSPTKPIDDALAALFPTSEQDGRLQKARRIMGAEVDGVSDQELENYLSQLEFLLDSWLDEYERQVFDGRTLSKVMQGG
jgi:hypothetical protein